jgi:hypothetical protein
MILIVAKELGQDDSELGGKAKNDFDFVHKHWRERV